MDPKNRLNTDEVQVNSNIARVRRRGMRLKDDYVTLSHGAGGKASAALVEQVFVLVTGNEVLDEMTRCGGASLDGSCSAGLTGEDTSSVGGKLAMSTDSYVVNPLVFPGGSIGELAVNGTVNDLAVSGAIPKVISAGFILEEGLAYRGFAPRSPSYARRSRGGRSADYHR
ncbi:AIR synthase related protein [Mobiluncus curtisii]|uniref:AIR synthase related protein n=1 Tax=Mobiluncus curtisii TaxID=2051 RepID=UPI002093DF07|nr:AIR synthase related protein [Mobiluncus curtisii]